MSEASKAVVEAAETYYDSEDADQFYFDVWGGEDIHIGLYRSSDDLIREASERTVAEMAKCLDQLPGNSRLLDLGAGYGGSARWLAQRKGFRVTCLNLSEVQNERNRVATRESGLDDLVDVVHGNFEELPFEAESFDAIWSQDAFLHSGAKEKVFREADRVLKPGGLVVFTDPMQTADVDQALLRPVLDRIHLDSMGSVELYREFAAQLGWKEKSCQELPRQLVNHYSRVREELTRITESGEIRCSPEFAERMIGGLNHWIDAGKAGALNWGIFLFQKVGD